MGEHGRGAAGRQVPDPRRLVVAGTGQPAAVRTLEELGHAVTDASPDIDWDTALQGATAAAVALAAPFLAAPRPPTRPSWKPCPGSCSRKRRVSAPKT
jgi:hypothetical protein